MQAADANATTSSQCLHEVDSTASSEDGDFEECPSDMTTMISRGFSRGPFKWQWERSGGKGWAPYTTSQSKRIEKAWRKGISRVLVRSGQEGKVPMHIFLVDMLQLDPISMKHRRVRRVGDDTWWSPLQREFRSLSRHIKTGEARWESVEQYINRQEALNGPTIEHLHARTRLVLKEKEQTHLGRWKKRCAVFANSGTFHFVTICVAVAQVIWIGVDVDKNHGLNQYDKPPFDQFLDYFFCGFFCVELFLRSTRHESCRSCWSSPWFCLDAVVVLSSLLEVLVVPQIQKVIASGGGNLEGLAALRALKAVKITRVFMMMSASSDAVPFFKGLLSGMRSAAFIWLLLFTLVFMFSVMVRVTSHAELLNSQFPSLGVTMKKLVVSGILLDNVGDVFNVIIEGGNWFTLVCFAAFIFLANFSLLNMLIGAFCSVADEVSTSEKDSARIAYLREQLSMIVGVYTEDDRKIVKEEFELIMNDVDVHRTLSHCGSDIVEVAKLKSVLFFRKRTIDFDSFFQAIVNLRKGQAATVKDLMAVQHALGHQLECVRKKLDTNFPGDSTSAD